MAQTITVEVWVLVDAAGDYTVGADKAACQERYGEDVQSLEDADGLRYVRCKITVPLPIVAELEGEVTADDEPAALSEVA